MLIGKIIGLRAIENVDLTQLRDWRNNEEFRKYFREYRELNYSNQENWFESMVVNNSKTLMFGIVSLDTKELVGVCGLCYIDWINRNADLSIYIGKDKIYIDTNVNGFAWDSLEVIFNYAFNRINLHKVWSEIYSFDEKKHLLFENYGLLKDGTLRDNYFYNGEYQDSHIYSITENDYRILKQKGINT